MLGTSWFSFARYGDHLMRNLGREPSTGRRLPWNSSTPPLSSPCQPRMTPMPFSTCSTRASRLSPCKSALRSAGFLTRAEHAPHSTSSILLCLRIYHPLLTTLLVLLPLSAFVVPTCTSSLAIFFCFHDLISWSLVELCLDRATRFPLEVVLFAIHNLHTNHMSR